MDSIKKRPFLFLLLAALIVSGLLVYSNILHSPFLFDDQIYITDNPLLRDLANFKDLTGTRYVTFLSFALNYAVGGYDAFGYHLVNVAIHIANGILLYLIVLDIFRTPALKGGAVEGSAQRAAFTAALLFTVHPVHTEAVAYITQRFAVLAAFFYLLSVLLYLRSKVSSSSDNNGRGWLFYALSLIFALVAQKTKEISFTLPAVIVLVEFMFFTSREKVFKRLIRLLPFLALFAVIPMTLFLHGGGPVSASSGIGEKIRALQIEEFSTLARYDYLLTQFRVIVTYMRLLVLPVGLNLDYDYPVYRSFFSPAVFISFFFLAGVFFSGVYLFIRGLRERRPLLLPLSFGILFFFITISVESSIVPIKDVIFEHRLYLPSAGAFLLVACLYQFFVEKAGVGSRRAYAMVPVLAVAAVLAFSAHERNTVWTSGLTLWGDVVRKSPNKARGYNNLGYAFLTADEIEKGARNSRAKKYFEMAVKLKPDYAEALNNIGVALVELDKPGEAIEYSRRALALKPDFFVAHNTMGIALAQTGRLKESIEHLRRAVRLNPWYADAYNNLGLALIMSKKYDEAVSALNRAVDLDASKGRYRKGLDIAVRLRAGKGQ